MQTSAIRELDPGAFEAEVLRAAGPVLVDFSAGWCPPCRMIEPVVAELAATLADRLTVLRLDVDRDPGVGARYGVLSMPTLILFSAGQPVDRLVGFSTAGPSFSSQTIRKASLWTSQLIETRPDSVESAPYLAELVTSSCKASAIVCAVAGCS